MSETVTPAQMDALLQFLPGLEAPGRSYVEAWHGGETTPDGAAITTLYPVYQPDVALFFSVAGQPCWSDTGYEPAVAARMLADDQVIRRATLDEIRTMLTYCVRGERFCDGHWESVLKSGRIVALLRRLAVIRTGLGRASGTAETEA